MIIHELKYSNTNTYLITGDKGRILFDTGWAGTFPAFCSMLGELGISVQSIDYILISHFHPDHMGIAQEISDLGPDIIVMDVQRGYVHSSDHIFAKEGNNNFKPVDDEHAIILDIGESRSFLDKLGISGEIIYTPGHSDDSISLWIDSGELFVGDLNPLYELELHTGTLIGESWEKLLKLKPKTVYYGHAAKAELNRRADHVEGTKNGRVEVDSSPASDSPEGMDNDRTDHNSDTASPEEIDNDRYELVSKIMKLIDKGTSLEKIHKKTGADMTFIEDVTRMYLTHQNVGVRGILDRIEIKGK